MRIAHFERFQPLCPTCRMANRPASRPLLRDILRADGSGDTRDVIEGMLVCPVRECQCEYPIINGIPFLVPNVRSVVAGQMSLIRSREDLSPAIDSLLCDCEPTDSEIMRNREYVSGYGRAHYGDLDTGLPAPAEDGLMPVLRHMTSLLAQPPRGAWLDIGCSVGRTTFELAAATGELALGVDMNVAMLKLARRVATTGHVSHPLRRVGIVYDQRTFAADLPGRERVDFWLCDARMLPFADHALDGATSLNVLDSVQSPYAHLAEIGRVLRPGAEAILTTPYEWTTAVTPIEEWIGGHSQRSPMRGDSAAHLRRWLSPDRQAGIDLGLTIAAEADGVPWRLYVHERATCAYRVHGLILRADKAAAHQA